MNNGGICLSPVEQSRNQQQRYKQNRLSSIFIRSHDYVISSRYVQFALRVLILSEPFILAIVTLNHQPTKLAFHYLVLHRFAGSLPFIVAVCALADDLRDAEGGDGGAASCSRGELVQGDSSDDVVVAACCRQRIWIRHGASIEDNSFRS